ncbi:MAG: 7-cyano-7-deazaguanine synthase QueC [Candidatus Omnitrophota bacterium]|jgi:7-cyano-7-deazaguanine synthase|nr:MAG: 7-cyano-7-deazaguanine synthase QueC [Candidatus Omnitrophota bacterium]
MRDNKSGSLKRKAVVLLSGGLDSATTLYAAKKNGFCCFCLSFDYGQRHRRELRAARAVAKAARCQQRVLKIQFPWKGSALLDAFSSLPHPGKDKTDIPVTYVPARNIIFLSFALSYAETIGAEAIFIGAHAQDYSGYPDCRPEFYASFKNVVQTGTKAGVKGRRILIRTPLLRKTKSEIVRLGSALKVPFALTWSCYRGGSKPCGNCDSCYYRAKGFKEAGIKDPLIHLHV